MSGHPFYEQVLHLLLSKPMEESLFQTLQFLEFSCQAGGFALLLWPSDATHATLLATSQLQNIQGLPIALPFAPDTETFSIDDPKEITRLATAMELDLFLERPRVTGILSPMVSHNSSVVLLMFSEDDEADHVDLVTLGRLFQLFLRDTYYLLQLRERTNPTARRKDNHQLSAIKGNRELFDNSSDGILVMDHHLKIVFINRMAESILGYAQSALVGRSAFELIRPESAEDFQEHILEPDANFEVESLTLSRETVVLRMSRSQLLSEQGLIVMRFWDVTEARQVQKQLSYTSDFLTRLVRNSSIAIVAGDTDGPIFLFSPAAEKLFGYRSEGVVGRLRLADMFSQTETWETIRGLLATEEYGGGGRVDQLGVDVRMAGTHEAPAVMSAFLVPQYQPGRDAVVAFFTDLRDKKAMEATIVEYQKRLEDTEKQAMLSTLAGTMAHELNQPLMSILGYTELLQRPNLPPEKLERGIRTISQEASRMADIVKKIGNITRYETRNYVGQATILDLDKGTLPRSPEKP